jgi:hypothetical protein
MRTMARILESGSDTQGSYLRVGTFREMLYEKLLYLINFFLSIFS